VSFAEGFRRTVEYFKGAAWSARRSPRRWYSPPRRRSSPELACVQVATDPPATRPEWERRHTADEKNYRSSGAHRGYDRHRCRTRSGVRTPDARQVPRVPRAGGPSWGSICWETAFGICSIRGRI